MREAMSGVDQGQTPKSVRVKQVDGLIARPDGNDVSMDREGLNLAERSSNSELACPCSRSRTSWSRTPFTSTSSGRAARIVQGASLGRRAARREQRNESVWNHGHIRRRHAGRAHARRGGGGNMANAETTRTAAGTPYKRQHVVFAANNRWAVFWIP